MAVGRQAVLILVLFGALLKAVAGQAPRFFADDPIWSMPTPLPLQHRPVAENVNDLLDFFAQSRNSVQQTSKPAAAINTLGDVPDSEWFTNRHGRHRMSRAELQRGPITSDAPIPPLTVTGGKNEGISVGFRLKDSKGRHYFVKADPLNHPELSSAADVIVSKFLYAIGYNVPENAIVDVKVSELVLSKTAKIALPGGRSRKMTWSNLEAIIEQIPHYRNGSFRIMASLAVKGEIIGPFRFDGTRSDDPNDTIAHEDRRDLRGLHLFSAWLNNTDAKASNTLDTMVEENGIRFIKHYLIDFGSALGSDGNGPKDARLGHEFQLPTTLGTLTRIGTIGIWPEPWERVRFPKLPGVGNFESEFFDAERWKPDYPNPAFLSRRPDDDYWAAKQIMAFTDDDIRAIVETAKFTDPRSTEYITRTLAERRNKIGKTYFSKLLPLDGFRVENEILLFDDLAVKYGFHAARTYTVQWATFDNNTQKHYPVTSDGSSHLPYDTTSAASGSYFSAMIEAIGDPLKPVTVYIHKEGTSYKVIGIDRSW
jgi:hypothetical protein